MENFECKSEIDHMLMKSEMCVGDTNVTTTKTWCIRNNKIELKPLTFSPALFKIFDEIVSNVYDIYAKAEKNNLPRVTTLKVFVSKNKISVYNNGPVIPFTKMENGNYIITNMFGKLRSSSNYTVTDKSAKTIGTYGIGAKATNIFSTMFYVHVHNDGQGFKQKWTDNMKTVSEASITKENQDENFTLITFKPELERFNMEEMDSDIDDVFKKRVFDLAATCPGMNVFYNSTKLVVSSIKDYFQRYTKETIVFHSEDGYDLGLVFDTEGFSVTFVNGCLMNNGTHVDKVVSLIVEALKEEIKKQTDKTNLRLSGLVKHGVQIYINCEVENAKYNGLKKEGLLSGILPSFTLSENHLKMVRKSRIIKNVISEVNVKERKEIMKKIVTNTKRIPKFDDATLAGSKRSSECTLILTEGDSAKTMVMAALKAENKKTLGVFPLRGKLLNVRNASNKQIAANEEIKHLISILGLNIEKKYTNMNSLRYGRVLLMTDQDQDGSHIKGLIINFIHSFWPDLIKTEIFSYLITPLIKATKGKESVVFYDIQSFKKWDEENRKGNYFIKYYKGLGTNGDAEAKECFKNLDRNTVKIVYSENDEKEIIKAFDKDEADARKKWLAEFNNNGTPEENVVGNVVTYSDFINKELIHFSNADNKRSIPNVIDGFKPGQRKIMHCVFNTSFKGANTEIKVERLAGKVASETSYHHGEDSLKQTIVSLAQDYVGSNNINFLFPSGQHGSRRMGGKDRGSPRYIFTNLMTVTRFIFRKEDDPILEYLTEENQEVEPKYFIPIIPTILVNGARGIGTGWSTKIPSFDPREIIKYYLEETQQQLQPWYNKFRGQITPINNGAYIISGNVFVHEDKFKIFITELPIGVWTEKFKENLMKDEEITVDDLSTKDDAYFAITFHDEDLFNQLLEKRNGFYSYFKLSVRVKTKNLIAFSSEEKLTVYESVNNILDEFKTVRLAAYAKRKNHMIESLRIILSKNTQRYNFIVQLMTEEIVLFKKKKTEIITILEKNGYTKINDSFDFLFKMPFENVSQEKLDELKNKNESVKKELELLIETAVENIWKKELLELRTHLNIEDAPKPVPRHFRFIGYVVEEESPRVPLLSEISESDES